MGTPEFGGRTQRRYKNYAEVTEKKKKHSMRFSFAPSA
jgi:hypothetical protein